MHSAAVVARSESLGCQDHSTMMIAQAHSGWQAGTQPEAGPQAGKFREWKIQRLCYDPVNTGKFRVFSNNIENLKKSATL